MRFQTIDGFGASDAWRCQFVGKNWPTEKREQIADWLFSTEIDASGNVNLGKKNPNGTFEVLGRFNNSDIRGCNLMVV